MKTNKLIGILLFLILSVMANAISITSYGASPTTAYVGDRYKIYMNFNESLDSRLEIRISGSSDCKRKSYRLGGGPKYWSTSATATKAGSAAIYFHAQNKSTGACKYMGKSVYFTVKEKSTPKPKVSSVNIPTLTKDTRSKIKFYGNNFVSGMAFTLLMQVVIVLLQNLVQLMLILIVHQKRQELKVGL